MNTRIVVATVAGGAALFLLGFLVYGLLLEGWMRSQMIEYKGLMNETPNFVTLIIANIVWALLVALIFDRWASISTFVGGLIGGAMISFLMILYFDLMNASFMNLFTRIYCLVCRCDRIYDYRCHFWRCRCRSTRNDEQRPGARSGVRPLVPGTLVHPGTVVQALGRRMSFLKGMLWTAARPMPTTATSFLEITAS